LLGFYKGVLNTQFPEIPEHWTNHQGFVQGRKNYLDDIKRLGETNDETTENNLPCLFLWPETALVRIV